MLENVIESMPAQALQFKVFLRSFSFTFQEIAWQNAIHCDQLTKKAKQIKEILASVNFVTEKKNKITFDR